MLASNEKLIERLDELEENYDAKFKIVFRAIRQLMNPSAVERKPIGFRPGAVRTEAYFEVPIWNLEFKVINCDLKESRFFAKIPAAAVLIKGTTVILVRPPTQD